MNYRFCPLCGIALTPLLKSNLKLTLQTCPKCVFTHYNNPKPCVVAVIVKRKKILLTRRAYEPFKDYWDFPGGFLECDEQPEDGLHREIAEELGIEIKVIKLLGIYPDSYGSNGDSTLNLYYLCKKSNGMLISKDEIAEFNWFDIDNIPKLAFKTNLVIADLMKKYSSIFKDEERSYFRSIY